MTERPGSSEYFAGGVVAYSNEAKTELLGVPAELIETPRRGFGAGRERDGRRCDRALRGGRRRSG